MQTSIVLNRELKITVLTTVTIVSMTEGNAYPIINPPPYDSLLKTSRK